ncbi:MAG: chromosome segregation protein SMC, partial [Candidatus Kapabacteria bacterium]|nr:chromosome segregation protein SMC [Candidatus Kapabacteria bacterium]
ALNHTLYHFGRRKRMYLSKLEIHGFKTFYNKTALHFTDGLTAIVGPNGSGKTNIVDAIRWVIGEQKASVLRSDGMEQVIFNGTRSRKPLGMAEVSLTIENNKHILPTEYSQVVLTRRLFRDGESTYMINKTPCRLRDIADLFMDTGMGAGAYSVIELKMIEQILSEKSDDRRHLFEEAAGVVKYKQRRKETLRRLAATQQDLDRVQDIIREVQKMVGSLSRQAEKAKSYSEIADKLKQLEHDLFRREYADTLDNLRSVAIDIEAALEERTALENKLTQAEQERASIEERDRALESELAASQEQERQASTRVSIAQQDLAVTQERLESMKRNSERARQDQVDTKRQLQQLKDEILRAQGEIEELLEKQEVADAGLQEYRINRDIALTAVQELRERSRIASEPVLAIDSRTQFLLSGRDRIRRAVDSLHQQSQILARNAEQTKLQFTELEDQHKRTIQSQRVVADAVVAAERRLHESRERTEKLSHIIDETVQTVSELREDLSHKRASLEFLESLVETNDSNQFLAASTHWSVADKRTLADSVTSADEYAIAIETALGSYASYFVVETVDAALQARELLKNDAKGKAAFLCRDVIPELPAPPEFSPGFGVLGYASELLETDTILRYALRGLLGNTLIVSDLETAMAVVNQGAEAAITLDGETVDSRGILRAGSVSSSEGMRVGKQQRAEQLRNEILIITEQITTADEALASLRKERATIDLHQLTNELRKAESEKSAMEQRAGQLTLRMQTLQDQLHQFTERIQQLSSENADALKEDDSINRELDELRERKSNAQQELGVFMNTLREHEQILSEKESALRQHEIATVRVNADLDSTEAALQRMIDQQHSLEDKMENSSKEFEESKISIKDIEARLVELQQTFTAINTEYTAARSTRMGIEARTVNARQELSAADELIRQTRISLESAQRAVHQMELKQSQYQTRADDFKQRALDEHQLDLDIPADPSTDTEFFTLEEARSRVQ